MKEKTVSESKTIMTEMIMPNDTNPLGNLMGGNLMRWMDIAAGVCAAKHAEAHVVTASVDHVSFQSAIRLGNVITITAVMTKAFSSSMEVYVEVTVAEITGANPRKSNHAYFTFVAVDQENQKPIKVPQLRAVSSEELDRQEGANRRREIRLILSGRIQPSEAKEVKDFFSKF